LVSRGACSGLHAEYRSNEIFLTGSLANEYVSLTETAEGEWTITFGPLTLGTYSEHALEFSDALAWTPLVSCTR
jgi:hypothetical protein